jgi:HSP20 family protein
MFLTLSKNGKTNYENYLESGWGRFREPTSYPTVNLYQNKDEIYLQAFLPGYDPKSLEITVKEEVLGIKGKRTPAIPEGGVLIHAEEAVEGSFERNFQLPFRIQADKVKAQFKNGILEATLVRAESDKPQKIEIITE